jgi:UDP-2,3-diacylglucosamine hydrolase
VATLFVSDIHLSPARPDIVRLFRSFLLGQARGADALYILGDLFEYWAGDDDLGDPFASGIVRDLAGCAGCGVPTYFMRGNRDFLVGEAFARAAGLTLLDDPATIDCQGRKILITHGDELCTDDRAYQEFRGKVRSPQWIDAFLARPLAERKREIESLRKLSEAEKRVKPAALMDVSGAAVEELLRRHGCPTLIHGHTHRPARHEHLVDGKRYERWVLADWYERGSYLACDAHGVRSEPLASI